MQKTEKNTPGRKDITVNYVLKSNKYLNIIHLLDTCEFFNKRPTFKHLKYALLKPHNFDNIKVEKCQQFFKHPKKKYPDILEQNTDYMYNGNLTSNLAFQEYADSLKFQNEGILLHYFSYLKKLNIITTNKVKNKHPYYSLTSFGRTVMKKKEIVDMMETLTEDETYAMYPHLYSILSTNIERCDITVKIAEKPKITK